MTVFVAYAAACPAPGAGSLRRFARRLHAEFAPAVCALLPVLALAGDSAPLDLVKDTTSRMLSALKDQQADIDQDEGRLYALISGIVPPHFDFNRMDLWTPGPYWRAATPPQRERFVAEFRQRKGVRPVTNHRSSFAAIVQQQGMDALIGQLAERNRGVGHE